LGAALNWLEQQDVAALRRREQELARQFYEGVRTLPAVTVYGDWSVEERCPIVSLNLEGWDAAALSDALARRYDIATRPGLHCAPLAHQALGTQQQGAVRFSFSHTNTREEVDRGIAALAELAAE
jgi:selenocysteine lyase/cysteine desulfurase